MKRLLLPFLFSCFFAPYICKAQAIGPMRIQYTNPGVINDLELIAQVMIPSQPSYRIDNHSRISNDTLYVTACYFAGMAAAPTTFMDTIPLGAISLNLSTLHFRISYSVSPQCNVINSTHKIQPFVISGPTGLKEDQAESAFFFYPNPARDFLILKDKAVQTITVRDLTGKIIQKQQLQGEEAVKINVSALNAGVYLLETISKDGKIHIQRFLKN